MEDAADLAPRVRQADRQEIKAHSGLNMEMSLRLSIQRSDLAWSFLHPDNMRVHLIAGLNFKANPWASSAPLDFTAVRFFVAVRRIVLDYMFEFVSDMANAVDARNTDSVEWLRREGFELSGPFVLGAEARPFYWFTGNKENFNHV